MNWKASRVLSSSLEFDIVVSGSFTVFGIVVANQSDSTVVDVEIRDETGDRLIIALAIPANDTKILDFTWMADKGLSIAALSANVFFSLFYTQEG
jgi:hypothetical protein